MTEYLIGVDDAGRGPVLGPMVLAGVLIEKQDEKILKELDVKDSKKIFPNKRKQLAKKIKEQFKTFAQEADANEINKLMDSKTNLNTIEALKAAIVINKLMQTQKQKTKIIVDCPSVNIVSWQKELLSFLVKKDLVNLVCEHKADVNHLAVAAASIIAKVKRDKGIEKIKKEINISIGSGYPSDPLTKSFLQNHGEHFLDKNIIRTHWQTWKKIVNKVGQKELEF